MQMENNAEEKAARPKLYFKYKFTKNYFNYKIQITFQKLTKYKIHAMYFKYVFQILVFQLLHNTG